MNNVKTAFDPFEFEQLAVKKFKAAGWDARLADGIYHSSDILLYHQNELVGYVELFYQVREDDVTKKLERLEWLAEKEDPELLILTNLTTFFVKKRNKDFQKTFVLPTPKKTKKINEKKTKALDSVDKKPTLHFETLALPSKKPSPRKVVKISDIAKEVEIADKEDEKNNLVAIEQCEKEFPADVWSKLSPLAKFLIKQSYTLYKTFLDGKVSVSPSIHSITESFEGELKEKIFDSFNSDIYSRIDSFTDPKDSRYIEQLEENDGFVPAKMMVKKLKYIRFRNCGDICRELYFKLRHDWDLDMLSDRDHIDDAIDLLTIRNRHSHAQILKDPQAFEEAKKKAIKVLSWFVKSKIN